MYKEVKSREEDLKEMEKYRRKYEVRYVTDEMEKRFNDESYIQHVLSRY